MARFGSAEVTYPSDTEIRVVRRFDAPAERVVEVWTTPEHVRRWWSTPDAPVVVCEIDTRPGGRWRYVTRAQDGTEYAWHGDYQVFDPPNRMVTTEVFEAFPDSGLVDDMRLSEADGVTTMDVVMRYRSAADREGHLSTGMIDGMQAALDRVEQVLAEITGTGG